mmetsp:Transcript_48704/g.136240  ORF Transcript_48704/g.136240 Transcript_48704/m.136240 type:complete len:88 (+) Transcript_48704:32-295(+)
MNAEKMPRPAQAIRLRVVARRRQPGAEQKVLTQRQKLRRKGGRFEDGAFLTERAKRASLSGRQHCANRAASRWRSANSSVDGCAGKG